MRFELNIRLDTITEPHQLADVLHIVAEEVASREAMPDGAGNVDTNTGESVGFWEVVG